MRFDKNCQREVKVVDESWHYSSHTILVFGLWLSCVTLLIVLSIKSNSILMELVQELEARMILSRYTTLPSYTHQCCSCKYTVSQQHFYAQSITYHIYRLYLPMQVWDIRMNKLLQHYQGLLIACQGAEHCVHMLLGFFVFLKNF